MTSTPPPPLPPPPSANKHRPSCAACKHRRQRCTADCLLAPYFTAQNVQDFNNVHRLFGYNNVVNLLKNVDPTHRSDAVTSVIYEANCRVKFPVGGCVSAIRRLQLSISLCLLEHRIVSAHLAVRRAMLRRRNPDDLSLRNDQDTPMADSGSINQEVDMASEDFPILTPEDTSSNSLENP